MPNVSPQRGAVSQCGTRCVRRLRCGPPQHHDSHVVSGRKRVHEAAPSKRPERTDHKLARTGNGGVAAGSMLGRRRAGRDLVLRACCSWVDGDGRAEAICQIPRRMKIVYTQGCSFGPERDNQLSYTRTSRVAPRLKRCRGFPGFHRNVARLLRCSTSITWLDASLGDASLGDEPRRDEM